MTRLSTKAAGATPWKGLRRIQGEANVTSRCTLPLSVGEEGTDEVGPVHARNPTVAIAQERGVFILSVERVGTPNIGWK